MMESKKEAQWIEFSLILSPELADLADNVLVGVFPGGLVREREFDAVFPDQLDQVNAPIRIIGYIPASQEADYKEQIRKALALLPDEIPTPTFSTLEEKNWAAAWQERYHPIPLGEELIIVPSWLENPNPERLAVWIDPDMAFGSGTHATTQLVLELMEKRIRAELPPLMIDVGCGSGILAITAAKLGVQKISGVDNDPDAIRVARDNALRNGAAESCEFFQGSVTDLLDQSMASNLVVANIIAPILEELITDGMFDLVSAGGSLILSGILEEQLSSIKDRLQKGGFTIVEELSKDGWHALWGEKIRER